MNVSGSGADPGETPVPGDIAVATPAPPSSGRFERVDWLWLGGIVLAAFVVRMIYVLQLRSAPTFEHEILDELYHDQWARAILKGERFADLPYFKSPLYPWFLAGVYKIVGGSYLGARLVQALIGAVSCGLVFVIGRKLFGRAPGVLAGLAAAAYWVTVFYDAEFVPPVLIIFLSLVLILLLLRAGEKGGGLTWLAAGVVLGLSAITRPDALLFGAAVFLWIIALYRPRWGRVFSTMGAFGVGAAAAILPITVRNTVSGGDFVLISSSGGVNFFIGNNPKSEGINAVVPGTRANLSGGMRDWKLLAERDLGRSLRPSEVSRYFFREGWKYMREHPGDAARLMWRKFLFFWSREELPNTKNLYQHAENYTPILRHLPFGFSVVAPFGLLGMVVASRRGKALFPLWGFVLIYMAAVTLFFVNSRFRVPIAYPLILFASFGFFWLRDALHDRRWRALGGGVPLLAGAAAFVLFAAPPVSRQHAESYFLAGRIKLDEGKPEEAIQEFRQALMVRWDSVESYIGMGRAFAMLGRTDEAVQAFETAVRLNPRYPASIHDLAALLLTQAIEARHGGDEEAAVGKLERAARVLTLGVENLAPQERPHGLLAQVLTLMGQWRQAEEQYRLALAINPNDGESFFRFGHMLALAGVWPAAGEHLKRGAVLLGGRTEVLQVIFTELLKQQRYGELKDILTARIETYPDDSLAVYQYGLLLSQCPDSAYRDGAAALRVLEPFVEVNSPRDGYVYEALGAAYAETGAFDKAVDAMDRAMELVKANRPPDMQTRLMHYESLKTMFGEGRQYYFSQPETKPAAPDEGAETPSN